MKGGSLGDSWTGMWMVGFLGPQGSGNGSDLPFLSTSEAPAGELGEACSSLRD